MRAAPIRGPPIDQWLHNVEHIIGAVNGSVSAVSGLPKLQFPVPPRLQTRTHRELLGGKW